MKFVPRKVDNSVNIPKEKPAQVFFKLIIILSVTFFAIYLILVGISEIVISTIPHEINHAVGMILRTEIKTPQGYRQARDYTQEVLERLLIQHSLAGFSFRADIVPFNDKNAAALPGGNIVITSSLLEEVESENELAMILAHELGHYYYNDHLRALSRTVIFGGLLLVANLGGGEQITNVILNSINIYDLKYSRAQEEKADKFALELLNKRYGHVAGAISIMKKLENKDLEKWTWDGILSTHPTMKQRIKYLQDLIRKKGYATGPVKPIEEFDFTESEEMLINTQSEE